ncbi:MAG: glutathione S-transferase N-terminal domain-containing protein [Rhodospirillaceae bacterium]|nr:glutathione S-transferase N-terminal domain-containing protein [Rhodospirillaceae bacterium]
MQLIGYYESPFVRRIGVTLMHYGIPFEQRAVATSERATIEPLNPLGRIPALVLDDGEALIDSTMILDYLDELAGPERALTPRSGAERRAVNRLVAVALGTSEKHVAAYYEQTKRPESHRWGPWLDRLEAQVQAGLQYLEDAMRRPYLRGDRMTQADVTTICAIDSIRFDMVHLMPEGTFPKLDALAASVANIEAFRSASPSAPVI